MAIHARINNPGVFPEVFPPPNFTFGYKLVKVDGGEVVGTVKLEGMQSAELVLPLHGVPRIAPTGMDVKSPRETVELTVRNGQVTALKVQNLPDGGVPGILKQLGVAMPHA